MSNLLNLHPAYKEQTLSLRRFKHQDIQLLIDNSGFETEVLGYSYEGRVIRKIKAGSGKLKVMLWSQMHGDEATATMAIFDLINFLKAKDDGQDELREEILSRLELHFIPMLNPDGAQRFQRRTAQGIDMNRDALALQCPESRILKQQIQDIKPEIAFNLHDQAIYYAAGDGPQQAAVSFLATAFNKAREWNEVRKKSMQLIGMMNDELQKIIPGKVGRFSDEFEPRAFGDNIQKWGSSLILIESGGYGDDTEKQYIRSLNFHIILKAFESIINESYKNFTLNDYEAIPENNRIFLDLKIENLTMKNDSGDYKIDIGILREEKNNEDATDFSYSSVIEELGDLSVFYGIKTLDAEGAVLRPVNDFPEWKSKDTDAPDKINIGEKATFVLDYGHKQILILNGEIV